MFFSVTQLFLSICSSALLLSSLLRYQLFPQEQYVASKNFNLRELICPLKENNVSEILLNIFILVRTHSSCFISLSNR